MLYAVQCRGRSACRERRTFSVGCTTVFTCIFTFPRGQQNNADNINLLLRKMAVAPNALFEPFDEDFVCLLCFTVLTLDMRPLALGGGIISLRHRVVLAPLTRLRASQDEMVPQAMCVPVARCFHVTNLEVGKGESWIQ